MSKFILVVLAVVACSKAADITGISDIFQDRMTLPDLTLEDIINNVEYAINSNITQSEHAIQCMKKELEKLYELLGTVKDDLVVCAVEKRPTVEEALAAFRLAAMSAGIIGASAADKLRECVGGLPDIPQFYECMSENVQMAAEIDRKFADKVDEVGTALVNMAIDIIECYEKVVTPVNKEAFEVVKEAYKCINNH